MRYPIIHQSDTMLCGIACLQMICNSYGKKYSANYIGELCCATTEGVSLSAVSYAADKLGLSSRTPRLGAMAWG
ncbi:MAG: hypothetical protein D8H98_03705 [Prevotella sp.]|nr:MAG: hypothetical protein D8H98_03705 [Prevotella sp.]